MRAKALGQVRTGASDVGSRRAARGGAWRWGEEALGPPVAGCWIQGLGCYRGRPVASLEQRKNKLPSIWCKARKEQTPGPVATVKATALRLPAAL